MHRSTVLVWMASSTGQPYLLFLPDAVTVHSVLALLDFETLMQLRVISKSFKSLTEQAAVAWMNQRYPAGLSTITRSRKEEAERQRLDALGAQNTKTAARIKRKHFCDPEEREKAWKTPFKCRSEAVVDSAPPSAAFVAVTISAFPAADTGAATCPTTTFSSPSSMATWLHSFPSTSPSPASYSVADAVWVMREPSWARALPLNAKLRPHSSKVQPLALVLRTEGWWRYCVENEEWVRRFGPQLKGARQQRCDVMDVLEVAFSVYGNSCNVEEAPAEERRESSSD